MAPATKTPRPNLFGIQIGSTEMRRAIPMTPSTTIERQMKTNRSSPFNRSLPSITEHDELITSISIDTLTNDLVVNIAFQTSAFHPESNVIDAIFATPQSQSSKSVVETSDPVPCFLLQEDVDDDDQWSFSSPKLAVSRLSLADDHDLPTIDDDLHEEQNQEIERILFKLISTEFHSSDKNLMYDLHSRVPAYVNKVKSSSEWARFNHSCVELSFHMAGPVEQLDKKLANDKYHKDVVAVARSVLIADHQLAVQNAQRQIEEKDLLIAEQDQKIVVMFEENGHLLCRIGKLVESVELESKEIASIKAQAEAKEHQLTQVVNQLSDEKVSLYQHIDLLVRSVDISAKELESNQVKLDEVSHQLNTEQEHNKSLVVELESSRQFADKVVEINQSNQSVISKLNAQVDSLQNSVSEIRLAKDIAEMAHQDTINYFQTKLEHSVDQTIHQSSTIAALQLNLVDKSTEIETLDQSNNQLRSNNQDLVSEMESLSHVINLKTQTIDQLTYDLSTSNDLVDLLTAQSVANQETIEHLSLSLDSIVRNKDHRIEELEKAIINIDQSNAEHVGLLTQQLGAQQMSIDRLRTDLVSSQQRHALEVESLNNVKLSEVAILKQQLADQQAAHQAMYQSILVQCVHARDAMIEHDAQTTSKVQEILTLSTTQSHSIEALSSRKESLSQSVAKLETDKITLEQELSDSIRLVDELKSSFEKERLAFNESIARLTLKMESEREHQDQLINQLRQTWTSELQLSTQSLEQLKSDLAAEQQSSKDELRNLQSRFDGERDELIQLIDRLNRDADAERQLHSERNNQLQQDLNEMRQTNQVTVESLENELNEQRQSNKQAIKQLKSQLDSERDSFNQQSSTYTSSIAELTDQVTQLREQLASSNTRSLSQIAEVDTLNAESRKQAAHIDALLAENADQLSQIEKKHRVEVETLTTQLMESRKNFATLNEQSISHANKRDSDAQHAQESITKANTLVKQLREQIADLDQQSILHKVQIVQLTDEKERAIKQLTSLRQENERINQSNKQAQSQISAATRSVSVPIRQRVVKQSPADVIILSSDDEENDSDDESIEQSAHQTAEEAHEAEQSNLRRSARLRKRNSLDQQPIAPPSTRSRVLVDRTNQTTSQSTSTKFSKHNRSLSAVVGKTRKATAVSFASEDALQELIE